MMPKLSRSLSSWVVLGAIALAGCQVEVSLGGVDASSSSGGGSSGGTTTGTGTGAGGWDAPQFTPDKVDLLFVVDNSGSMADKQEVLRLALADVVSGMTNPPCLEPSGLPASAQPASGLSPCPTGTSRARSPVNDMHIGVISSSLGGHGSGACPQNTSISNNDMAHLLARSDPQSTDNDLPTYHDRGFLVWDAAGSHGPAADSDPVELATKLGAIVEGVGQAGCGFEAPLESFYRFLVDPEPYVTIELQEDAAVPTGIDQMVLQQRRDFLRPDSLLLIVMLSDENDCSIKDGGRDYLVAETRNGFRLWRPRSECAINPNDPCCKSCSQDQSGCPADPTCTRADGSPTRLSAEEDPVNLRCWDHKRRFGFDFLYPIERYIEALTSPTVPARNGDLVPNPIFSDLDPEDDNTRTRGPQHIVFTGIVGVPWQDLARQNADGVPDLVGGLDAGGNPVGGLKDAGELDAPVPGGFSSTWEIVLGDPANHVAPADPFMIESQAPRAGANPITGDQLVHPDATGWNAINGREYTIPRGSTGDLQYACIFNLLTERSCEGNAQSCDCSESVTGVNDSPLCKPEGTNGLEDPGNRETAQERAKAYPGLRELQLLQRLGEQGVAGSICPAQISDASSPDYGYRPIMNAVLDRLSSAL
ncbi:MULTISPECIES: hypothetical protein [Sorangium]|uniref:hypothetical protein n=1 Tax=Sorangium TaxID=39643 RepID=UPI003D9C0534